MGSDGRADIQRTVDNLIDYCEDWAKNQSRLGKDYVEAYDECIGLTAKMMRDRSKGLLKTQSEWVNSHLSGLMMPMSRTETRVILMNPHEIEERAESEVPKGYEGKCEVKVAFTDEVILLPNGAEAELVAGFACTLDGGFGSTVVAASEELAITHESFEAWMVGYYPCILLDEENKVFAMKSAGERMLGKPVKVGG